MAALLKTMYDSGLLSFPTAFSVSTWTPIAFQITSFLKMETPFGSGRSGFQSCVIICIAPDDDSSVILTEIRPTVNLNYFLKLHSTRASISMWSCAAPSFGPFACCRLEHRVLPDLEEQGVSVITLRCEPTVFPPWGYQNLEHSFRHEGEIYSSQIDPVFHPRIYLYHCSFNTKLFLVSHFHRLLVEIWLTYRR